MTASEVRAPDLVLTFYGDDFTGSTDALEAAAIAGIPAMLFLSPPTLEDLARFPGIRAVGVAGSSRSQSPEWMDRHLPDVFVRLKALGAPLCHYKTCSTFDSSPTIGNIGRACEIGQRVFGAPVLVVVGVTKYKRYVMFSTLYAAGAIGGAQEIFRIDRHPTMSRHPVTPMAEADLRQHLAKQTKGRIAGFDFRRMLEAEAGTDLHHELRQNDIVILDTFDSATSRAAGRLIFEHAERQPAFVVGSSGIESALIDHLVACGKLPADPPVTRVAAVDRLIALYGSCSPVSEAQINWAEANGLEAIAVDTAALVEDDSGCVAASLVEKTKQALSTHAGVVLHTALGPNDARLAPTRAALERRGLNSFDSSHVLGSTLGRVLRDTLAATDVRRVVMAGGDSSSHAVSAMNIESLGFVGPLVLGSPLCRIHARDAAIDGIEITLKGGQVGAPNFLAQVFAGH